MYLSNHVLLSRVRAAWSTGSGVRLSTGHCTPTAWISLLLISITGLSGSGAIVYRGHPLLSQKSLMRLSSLLTMEVCQRAMIDLGMSADRITIIRREANKQYMPEEFLLLLTWCQGVRGTKDDCDVIKDIEVALQHIGRRDLALKIARAREEQREIDNQDAYD